MCSLEGEGRDWGGSERGDTHFLKIGDGGLKEKRVDYTRWSLSSKKTCAAQAKIGGTWMENCGANTEIYHPSTILNTNQSSVRTGRRKGEGVCGARDREVERPEGARSESDAQSAPIRYTADTLSPKVHWES